MFSRITKINVVSVTSKQLTIEVYDSLGQKVGSYKNLNRIDISHLENGVYHLRITDETGGVAKRIVKTE